MALELKFDLMDLLRTSQPRSKQKALAPLVKRELIKREFGNRVIDEIKSRTLRGRDKNNNSFVPNTYSKSYQESHEFRVFGKSRSPVNLRLSGEMQASISVVDTSSSGVTIGFVSREQEQKARGHIMGSGSLPVRDFWGIPKNDQIKILKSVIRDFNETETVNTLTDALSALGQVTIDGETVRGDDAVQAVLLSTAEETNGEF
jgi:hypothetical protein